MGRMDQNDSQRSEALRRKRTVRSQQRVNTVTSRVINPVNSRPVIVRGKAFGTPIHHQAGTRPRRQYYLTMDQASGAELRLPAIPLVNPGWRLASGLLVILLAFGIFSFWNSPYFQISGAEVKGVERLSPEEINKTLRLENMSIIEIDPAKIQEELTTTYPELVNVQVQVNLPNFVTVTAVERKPVVAIQKGDQITWVDADGILFPARGDAGALVTLYTEDDLPLLIQPDPDAIATQSASSDNTQPDKVQEPLKTTTAKPVRIDPTLLAAAQDLSQKLPAETKLVYSKQNGLGWTDPGGWQVFIGKDLSDFETKYTMYQTIVSYLTEQGKKLTMISVEQTNAPYYRVEQ